MILKHKTLMRISPLLAAGALLACLCACGEKTPELSPNPTVSATPAPTPSPTPTPVPTPTPAPTPTPTPEPTPTPTPEIENPNPLTGLPMETDAFLDTRPYAVMINNLKAALPQYGICQADIIYEVLAEGGITRMEAIYQDISQVPQIGSVRSTRSYYLDIAQGHDAIHIHAGGSPQAYSLISSRGIDDIDGIYVSSVFWRDQERIRTAGYEHSMFTSGELVYDYVTSHDFRLTLAEDFTPSLTFTDDGAPEKGTDAGIVSVRFSDYKTGVFTYDPDTGFYAAEQYGEAYADGQDDSQVTVTNVLVLYAKQYAIADDDAGRQEVDLVGEGDGVFACGGKCVPIKWSKADCDQPFVYTLENGDPLELGRGRSYINIVPAGSDVTFGSLPESESGQTESGKPE